MTRSLVAMLATAPFAAGFAGPRPAGLAPDQVALPFGIVTGNTNRFESTFYTPDGGSKSDEAMIFRSPTKLGRENLPCAFAWRTGP